MAYLELILLVAAIVTLIVMAQRSRLKASEINMLREVADAHGLTVEAGEGTAELVGTVAGRPVRVHAIIGGWAVTVSGVVDQAAARRAAPDAQVGAGKLQLRVPLDVAGMTAAIDRAVRATRT